MKLNALYFFMYIKYMFLWDYAEAQDQDISTITGLNIYRDVFSRDSFQ